LSSARATFLVPLSPNPSRRCPLRLFAFPSPEFRVIPVKFIGGASFSTPSVDGIIPPGPVISFFVLRLIVHGGCSVLVCFFQALALLCVFCFGPVRVRKSFAASASCSIGGAIRPLFPDLVQQFFFMRIFHLAKTGGPNLIDGME